MLGKTNVPCSMLHSAHSVIAVSDCKNAYLFKKIEPHKKSEGCSFMKKQLRILGTRGIPANHGGFETFAEHLSLYLVGRGWEVTVYCQESGNGGFYEDSWKDVRLIHIPVKQDGVLGTIIFDWRSTLHACNEPGMVLTLGYNTAVFCSWYRFKGLTNLINMDGIEWRRQKWGPCAKAWFYANERIGSLLGNHLVADHPHIEAHLLSRVSKGKITTIAYGAPQVTYADKAILKDFGLSANAYATIIARPEPENSILEIVRAWSRKERGMKLVVLGHYLSNKKYHRMVREAASDEVLFPGALYEPRTVNALRFFSRLYIHGHQVGGTNPTLVEALGAGNAVLAHDNPFNRWVAGEEAKFFSDEDSCAEMLEQTLHNEIGIALMRKASARRHLEAFTWQKILAEYENLLLSHLSVPVTVQENEVVSEDTQKRARKSLDRNTYG